MGIWDSIAGLFKRGTRTAFRDVINRPLVSGVASRAGVTVTWERAVQLSAVFGCLRVISEGVAQAPLHLYRGTPGGGAERVKDHPIAALLAQGPNDRHTFFEFIETMALHAALTGNAFCIALRGVQGNLLSLWPVQPDAVEIIYDTQNKREIIAYRVRLAGEVIDVDKASVWHLRGPAWTDSTGLDIVSLARETIGLGIATETFSAKLFAQGARPGGILSVDEFLDPEQEEQFIAAWRQAYEGADKDMSTIFLHGGAKFEKLSMTNDEAQHMETRRFMIEEICRFFRVLPIMVGSAEKSATYASSEQMFIAHVVHTMLPWFRRFETSMNKHLLTIDEVKSGLYFRFNVSGLLRGSAIDRAQFYSRALGAGGAPAWMTQDEVRALEELNPLGGAAAQLPQPTNVATGGGAQ